MRQSLILLLTVALSQGAASGSAEARPRWLRLSLIGDSGTQIGVAWNSPDGPAEARVQFGREPEDLRHEASGHVRAGRAPLGPVSEVLLSGLSPNQRYYYRVGGPRAWSAISSFRTAPPAAPDRASFRFAFVADSRAEKWDEQGGAGALWPGVLRRIAPYQPVVLLHGGDIVRDGRRQAEWVRYLELTEPFWRSIPIMPVIGNHDDGPRVGEWAHFNQVHFLPRSSPALGGSGTEDFYAFEVGHVLFVALSTVTFPNGERPFARQARWLDRVLGRSDKLWRVVYLHHPIYTGKLPYMHPPNEKAQNGAFVPLFARHGVDIVIGAHNHLYERFAPSRCAAPASAVPCPPARDDDTVYLTSGGGGAYPVFAPGRAEGARRAVSGRHHFLVFEVSDGELIMEAVDLQGNVIDRLRRAKAPVGNR